MLAKVISVAKYRLVCAAVLIWWLPHEGFGGAAQHCAAVRIELPQDINFARGVDIKSATVDIKADVVDVDDAQVKLQGGARVLRGGGGIYADNIIYNNQSRVADARGAVVFYTANGDEIRATNAQINTDDYSGTAADINIKLVDESIAPVSEDGKKILSVRTRGSARAAKFLNEDLMELQIAELNNCPAGNSDVVLRAEEIKLNRNSGTGHAKHMRVYFKGVPIFYFPYLVFPIDNKRRSGFLFPRIGYDGDSGATIAAPYYLNLAPNYDALITPQLLSRRGAQLGVQLRYLGARGGGEAQAKWLDSDDQFEQQDRYAMRYQYAHQFDENWRADLDWQRISDRHYLRDLADDINSVAMSYLPQRSRLDYFGDALQMNLRSEAYDVASPDNNPAEHPFDILPQLNLNYNPSRWGGFEFNARGEYTNFVHSQDRTQGTRIAVQPALSLPLEKPYGWFSPRIAMHTLDYKLDNSANAPPRVRVPIYSIDSGLIFDRNGGTTLNPLQQSLEARLFYLNIPFERRQNQLPIFDTNNNSQSSFAHLFRDNRFVGGDRIGDTEQISLGITNRIFDRDGGEKLNLSLGQIFYLQNRKIVGCDFDDNDCDRKVNDRDQSALVGEFDAHINNNFSAYGFMRWGEDEYKTDALRLAVEYNNDARATKLGYTFEDDLTEQIDLSLHTKVSSGVQFYGRGAYSLQDDETHSLEIGLDFNGCCWKLLANAQQYLDGGGDYKNRFLMTLELDGLGRIGIR